MSGTLTYSDVIQRTGHTIVDGVKVVQYVCTLPLSNPQAMRITSTRLNVDLYKANREICRNDLAAFEDAAYQLQDDYVAKMDE